jgi:hypothetical protein
MYAIPVDALNAIIFSPKAPPKGYEEYHGEVQSGVSLAGFSADLYHWPEGKERPDVVLARSLVDDKEYRVFKYLSDFERRDEGYEDTGRTFCIISNAGQFVDLMRSVIRLGHRGEWVAWSEDGSRLLAAGSTPEEVNAAVDRTGAGPAIFEWVEPRPAGVGR